MWQLVDLLLVVTTGRLYIETSVRPVDTVATGRLYQTGQLYIETVMNSYSYRPLDL
jgi:hypothetical protein